jgi:cell division protein FtsB
MFEDMARRFGLFAVFLALLFVVFFCENGIADYMRLKSQMTEMDTSIRKLDEENVMLKGEIERLQKDDRYLEEVARKRFGFIREGEKVYRIEK